MNVPSTSAPAPLPPAGLRPEWVRPGRRATVFWAPTAAVFGTALVLVLLWPRNPHRGGRGRGMPEATASYVLLEGSYLVLPGNPLGNPWPGPGGGSLPEREDVATRCLPAPEYSGIHALPPWTPALLGLPAAPPPSLATRPVSAVLAGAALATNSLVLTLSPGLARAGFLFDVPPGITTGMPAAVRFQVELDDQGEVAHLLAEASDNPAAARLLETAVGRGRGTRAGRGEVAVSWGK